MGAPSLFAAALAVLLRSARATEVVITAATTADMFNVIRGQVGHRPGPGVAPGTVPSLP